MGSKVRRSELWSVLVFVVGVTIGIAGATLAIIFGVQKDKPCSCGEVSAELFSSQIGIQKSYMAWDDNFYNQSSPQYLFAVQNLSAALTSALNWGSASRRMFAALPTSTSASVQVAELREGKNGTIICFAYGTVYGNVDKSALPSYSTIQSQIDSTDGLATSANVDRVSSPANSPCNVTNGSTTSTTKTSVTTTTPGTTVSTPKNRLTTQITTASTQKEATSPTPSTKPATPAVITTKPSYTSSTTTTKTSVTTQTTPKLTTPSTSPTQTTKTSRPSTSTSASSSTSTTQAKTTPTSTSPTTSQTLTSTSSTPKSSSTSPLTSSPSPSTKPTTVASSTPSSTKTTSTSIPSTSSSTRSTTARQTTASTSGSTNPPLTSGVTSTVSTAPSTKTTSTPSLTTQSTPTSKPSTSTSTVSALTSSTLTSTVSAPTSTVSTSVMTTKAPQSSTVPISVTSTVSTSVMTTEVPQTSTVPISVTSIEGSSSSQSTLAMETTVVSTTQSSLSPTTSTSLLSTTPMETTTVTPCTGVLKYSGDIAVAFELTTNTSQASIEDFVTTLLTYANNPYSFSPDAITNTIATAYMLAPYPQTADYYPPTYGQGIDSISQILKSFNALLKICQPYNAEMLDALNFIKTTTNLHPTERTIVLVGVSDLFVNDALEAASNMRKQGFEIFTVNMGVGDLSPLASDSDHAYNVITDSDEVQIAGHIGDTLLKKSPICFHAQKPTTTTALPKSTSTSRPLPTTTPCNAAISQDIAFVIEISTSTGSLDASKAAAKFITNYLMDNHFDDEHSNYSIVAFPDPGTYQGLVATDFLDLHKNSINATFNALFKVFSYVNNGRTSDIESGLSYAQDHEFPLVSSDSLPHTVLLFANSADGVNDAMQAATNLKNTGKTILTVTVGDTEFDLRPLASNPDYYWSLPVSSDESYAQLAEKIISQLLQLGKVCR